MSTENYPTLDEVFQKRNKDAAFWREYYRQEPFFDLAHQIFNLRKELQLTQQELAKRSHTHQSRISKIESADLDVRLSTIIKIAETLGKMVDIKLLDVPEWDSKQVVSLFSSKPIESSQLQTPTAFTTGDIPTISYRVTVVNQHD